jgi:pyrimidine-nucleoside phosphorylase
MVSIGELCKSDVAALLSDMNQPLGVAVGNAIEVKEAIQTLKGEGPKDFTEHCLEIASQMLLLGQKAESLDKARRMAEESIESGAGLDYLKKLVKAQGGEVNVIDHPELLPEAPVKTVIEAQESGYISEVHARTVGETAVVLGAGRMKKGDSVDPAVGISVMVKVGDAVEIGQPLFVIHARSDDAVDEASQQLKNAVKIGKEEVAPLPLFYWLVD